MNLDETQLAAVEHAIKHRFSIITGGAGTGKTTIIKEIQQQLKEAKKSVCLCAFAGKAAARLKEATKSDASTIHRLLGYMGKGFTRDSLKGYSVIVDEASMVDSELMAEIIKRAPDKLILVGDAAQLPPVGKGQPFHDIIALRPDLVYTLTKCYRNSEAVFRAAIAIRNNESVRDADETENEKWAIHHTGGDKQTHDAIIEQVKKGALDFAQDIILCPKNGSEELPCSVKSLNQDIANIVLPRKADEEFAIGDRVMVIENNAEKDIWNGTTGTVHAIATDTSVTLKLDEPVLDMAASTYDKPVYKEYVSLNKQETKKLTLAYCMTVHKSQGSQYRKVVFVCLRRDARALLSRPLIYTAVTRTRKQCIVVGDKAAFAEGCRSLVSKNTIIQQFAKGMN